MLRRLNGRKRADRSRLLPFVRVVSGHGRTVLLACGHTFTTKFKSHPVPKHFAGCEACWWANKSREPGLKTYWFAKVGRAFHRAFRWGQLMDDECAPFVERLLVVRAETLEDAVRKLRRGESQSYQREEVQWRGLTPSPSCRRSARFV